MKFLWGKQMYGWWSVTGLIGPNGDWFLGFSRKAPTTDSRTDGVPEVPAPQPTPYGLAGIEGDTLVIRLTADSCAFAFANDPQARRPRPPVVDKRQFLRHTLNELTAEREDGSTPLTDVLDRAMVKAMENGSDALDHDAHGVMEGGRG